MDDQPPTLAAPPDVDGGWSLFPGGTVSTDTNPQWADSTDTAMMTVPYVAVRPSTPTPIHDRLAAAWLLTYGHTVTEMMEQFRAAIKYAKERVNAL